MKYYLPSRDGTPWAVGGVVYIVGAIIYAMRIPEKFFPRKFDLVGSSHQIFHLAVLGGFTIMFVDSVRLYDESKNFVCPIKI